MRQNNTANPRKAKDIARRKYAERQIDKFTKWSIEQRGFLKYKDLVEQQDKYNINISG
jgi:hypothetical protein